MREDGECGSSSACWRDEGAFKRALIAAARARLTAFGRRARGGDDGGDNGDADAGEARGARKRMKRTSANGDDSAAAATRARDDAAVDEDEDEDEDASARALRAYEEDVERVCGECISSFAVDAPFTIQRICELVCEPEKYYASPTKLMNAILKLFTVTQTVDRGCAGGVETKVKDEVPTKAMVRDARDPVASEQKAFVARGVRRARRWRRRRATPAKTTSSGDDRRSMGTTTTRCNNTTRANTRPDRPRRRRCTRDEHILMRDEDDIRGNAQHTSPRPQNATRVDPNSSDDEGWRCARERSVRASRERARASVHVGGGGGNRTLGGGDYLWKT